MRRKYIIEIACVLSLLLIYGISKRYVFPTVEQNVAEEVKEPDQKQFASGIEIQKKEMGEEQDKITYFVTEVQLEDATELKTAFAHNQYGLNIRDTVSDIAGEHQAVFAVNGDYYGFRTDGIVIRNGVLYRDEPTERECLVMYRDGHVEVMKEGSVSGEKLIEAGAWNVFSFGPVLVEDGKVRDGLDEPYHVDLINESISGKQPRTGIGILGPNHFLIATVDGRAEGYSCGMTFRELAELFVSYGCELAYNLDGGSSVTLYREGEVINRPCTKSGKERNISDIIYIGEGGRVTDESSSDTGL